MSLFRNVGSQVNEYEYDFAVDGGATGAINLYAKENAPEIPSGAVIMRVCTKVVTALAGTGASASLGFTGSTAAYVAAGSITGWGKDVIPATALSAPVVTGDNHQAVLLTISGAALTAGKAKVFVEFIHGNV